MNADESYLIIFIRNPPKIYMQIAKLTRNNHLAY